MNSWNMNNSTGITIRAKAQINVLVIIITTRHFS